MHDLEARQHLEEGPVEGDDMVRLALALAEAVNTPEVKDLTVALLGTALRQARRMAMLEELCSRDALTTLLNRRGVLECLDRERARAERHRRELSVLFLDLDRFKEFNDRYGHRVGDEVLRAVADRASRFLRFQDTVGRLGGDEFLVILPDTGEHEAREIGHRLAAELAGSPVGTSEGALRVEVSFGAASLAGLPDEGDLVECADRRMLARKNRRRRTPRRAVPRPTYLRAVDSTRR
jgi:diguanylate cyclase (GGDEF)-like protein